jgi:AcrR family transcriptional regulator
MAIDSPADPLPDTREHIVRAAEEVVAEVGMRNATTRAIAQRAGCAEGTLYRYFSDKHALFMEVAKRGVPSFGDLAASLPDRAGTATVQANLEEVARAALAFHRAILPMACGIMTEYELLQRRRQDFRETGTGPMRALADIEEYLRREQRLGRMNAAASPGHAARVVMETCFGEAFLQEMVGGEAQAKADETFAREIVRIVLDGVAPRPKNAKGASA